MTKYAFIGKEMVFEYKFKNLIKMERFLATDVKCIYKAIFSTEVSSLSI